MKDQNSFHHRRPLRLKEYDYSRPGAYFITICTADRQCMFGNVVNGEMVLNQYGWIVFGCWRRIENHFSNIELDYFVIMPNHIHGIIFINMEQKGLINQTPTRNLREWILMKNSGIGLGKIIRYFKARTTKRLRDSGLLEFKWQRLFYDHIIRNNRSLDNIRQYIVHNPMKWEMDKENPQNWKNEYM